MTITLHYLDNSRAFRVLWTAHELGISSHVLVKTYPRIEGKKAVPEMTSESGFSLGKSPFLVDQDEGGEHRVEVFESVACIEYLIERYGGTSQLIPPPEAGKWKQRTKVTSYLSFCETLMLHSLAIIYAQWFTPAGNDEVLRSLTESMSGNVCKDLDLLERTLEENKAEFGAEGMYLANGRFSAADIANAFSAEYVLVKGIGTSGKKWPNVEAWLRKMEQRPAYQATKKQAGLHDFTLLEQDKGRI